MYVNVYPSLLYVYLIVAHRGYSVSADLPGLGSLSQIADAIGSELISSQSLFLALFA